MTNDYFKLFANCIIVKGYLRSVIVDLQRNDFDFIPNELAEIIKTQNKMSRSELQAFYGKPNEEILAEYFQFLIDKEYGFWCSFDELELFPGLDMTWDSPHQITNAIIDVGIDSKYDILKPLAELEDLGCKDIEIRIFDERTIDFLNKILAQIDNSRIKSVQLVVRFNSSHELGDYLKLCQMFARVSRLTLFAYAESKVFKFNNGLTWIVLTTQTITGADHCGIISADSFACNLSTFTESQSLNTCLNRKVSVDMLGNIKNCPSMRLSYGNVTETSLHSAITQIGFKDLWSINKDRIDVCRDCEFRHICTDCRAFITDSDNLFSKPSKCNYDPYTAKWLEDKVVESKN